MGSGYELAFALSALQIVLIDLVLSGDNAIIIGMATRRLDLKSRKKAVVAGALGAILLRITFTGIAAISLLKIPMLQFAGGLALIWIALRLLLENSSDRPVEPQKSMYSAVKTIILADLIMSMDNVLAVGGASRGNLALLVFGLLLSMPLLIAGSQLVASVISRFNWLTYAGAGIIAWVGGRMVCEDKLLKEIIPQFVTLIFSMLAVLFVLTAAKIIQHRQAEDTRPRKI
ncbi:MAG: TerC family protein [Eubacteriales bacterium]